jgi:hypothetical protein
VPLTHTLWYVAPERLCRRTLERIHRARTPLCYQFHAADLLGLDEDGVDARMARHPGMRWPLARKLEHLERILRDIASRYDVVTYAESVDGSAKAA